MIYRDIGTLKNRLTAIPSFRYSSFSRHTVLEEKGGVKVELRKTRIILVSKFLQKEV